MIASDEAICFFCACVEQLLESSPQESGTTNFASMPRVFVSFFLS
jgi:hypothetical protein